MATYRMNLAGTYEFFTLSDAHATMDRDSVPAGAIVVVDGRTYVAMWYDEEKRMVLRRTRGDEEMWGTSSAPRVSTTRTSTTGRLTRQSSANNKRVSSKQRSFTTARG